MNKNFFLLLLAIHFKTHAMEREVLCIPKQQTEFLELAQKFEHYDDIICREKKYDQPLVKQNKLLTRMQKILITYKPLQTIENYTIFNADLTKKIANTILQIKETKRTPEYILCEDNSDPNLYSKLVKVRKQLLKSTKIITNFNDKEHFALNDLSIGIHHLLSVVPKKDFYIPRTLMLEFVSFFNNSSIIHLMLKFRKQHAKLKLKALHNGFSY